jgi:nucleotide-binding universal stress UspA family protein
MVDLQGATYFDMSEVLHLRMADARRRLAGLVPGNARGRVGIEMRFGSTVEEIVRCAGQMKAACLIIGAHRRRLVEEIIFGTTFKGVLRASPCPVWIVPALASARLHEMELELASTEA